MIALDTNLLVYAHREDSPWHAVAYRIVVELAEGMTPWAIPWQCIYEFVGIATHPRIYTRPTPLSAALRQVEAWLASPSLRLLSEHPDHWETLQKLLIAGKISGPLVHDARVAAICLENGIKELWTADRDFSRFPALRARNPLLAAG